MTSIGFFTQLVGVLGETDAKVILGLFVAVPSAIAAWGGYQSAMARREATKQLTANGGSSMRDAIDRIEKRLTSLEDYITNPKES